MKVAICTPLDLNVAGGVETHIRQLARAMRASGQHVEVFAKAPDHHSRNWPELIPDQYDIIHTHGCAFCLDFLSMAIKRFPYQRHVHTLHGVSVDYLVNCRTWLNWRCYTGTLFEGALSRHADHVIAVSNSIKQRARQCFAIPGDNITVIYNGCATPAIPDTNRTARRNRWKLTPEITLCMFVGRGDDTVKGAANITAAMNQLARRYPQLRLLAVPGDGFTDAPWLIRSGHVEHDTIHQYYNAADIFINASLNEGMPLTVIEAMAAGLPIVAAPVGGIPEIITHNQSGLLTKPDRTDLITQLQTLIENPALRQRLGQNARQTAQALTWDQTARKTRNIYEQILA